MSKAATIARVSENRVAADLMLPADALASLDAAFPPPLDRCPLEVL